MMLVLKVSSPFYQAAFGRDLDAHVGHLLDRGQERGQGQGQVLAAGFGAGFCHVLEGGHGGCLDLGGVVGGDPCDQAHQPRPPHQRLEGS